MISLQSFPDLFAASLGECHSQSAPWLPALRLRLSRQLLYKNAGAVVEATWTPPSTPAKEGQRNLVGTLEDGAGWALNTINTLSARLCAPLYATSVANFLD